MHFTKKLVLVVFAALSITMITACAPEVGSPGWCSMMKEKPKGEWSANEAGDFAQHCIMN